MIDEPSHIRVTLEFIPGTEDPDKNGWVIRAADPICDVDAAIIAWNTRAKLL